MADRTPSRPGRSSSSRSAGGARPPAPRSTGSGAAASSGAPARTGHGRGSAPRQAAGRSAAGKASGTRPGTSRAGAARPSRPGPGKERPALAARARTPQPAPPSASTAWVRGAILLGILVMLAVTLLPTLRSLIQQRGDTAALQDKVAQQRQSVQDLEHQAALWKDPAYIEVQARERLKFVRVGDRAYTVIDTSTTDASAPAAGRPVVAAPMANASSPWYGKAWQSIQIADRPTVGVVGAK